MAERRGLTMGRLVELMYLDEASRERRERRAAKEWSEVIP
jgi:hypothetical protein